MAMTETRPEAAADAASAETENAALPVPAGGLAGILGSGDPTVIGRLWIATSVVFLVGVGVVGGLLGAERFDTAHYNVFDNAKHLNQAFSIHAVGGLFLVAIPLLVGVATVVVPRQIGAPTIAFPRAASLAYWSFLIAGVLLVVSYLIDGGPSGGRETAVELFIASLAMVALAIVVASVCLATTVLALRPAGMSLDRVPAFSWSVLVAAGIWITTLGFLVGELVLLYLDRRYQAHAFTGDSLDLDRWLYWTTTQPQIYAAAIPVLGFALDAAQTASGARLRRGGVLFGAMAMFGAVSFGAWTFMQGTIHPELTRQTLFVGEAFGALLPIVIVLGGIGEALVKGKPRLVSPLLFGIASLLMLGAAVVAGALRSVDPFRLIATTADSSVAHYALGAAVIAGIGALHYWWPQILGRPLNEAIGRATAALTLVGVLVLATPDLISGFLDEPRRSLNQVRDGVEALNVVSFVGGVILVVAVLAFIVNLATSLGRRGVEGVDGDPWDGLTLEWASDPAMVPITSAAPLLDQKESSE